MLNNDLIWLLYRYAEDYQNHKQVKKILFHTIENPGWYLKVSFNKGALLHKPLTKVFIDRTEDDWVHCIKEDNLFSGHGGPLNLPEILSIFSKWAKDTNHQKAYQNLPIRKGAFFSDHFMWLLEWFYSQYDEYWAACYSSEIVLEQSTWHLAVKFAETELEDKVFDEIKIKHSEDDWLHCYTENKIFHGVGGIFNLPEMLSIFCNWAQEAEPSQDDNN